jgi:hypothetical protein
VGGNQYNYYDGASHYPQGPLQSDVIKNMPIALKALYDADIGQGHIRGECTKGTRVAILSEIEGWATGDSDIKTLGYWICGMAGTGKSTIAMSICKKLEKKQVLGATFFCSRQIPECRDHSRIIPTIAQQLAKHIPSFAEALVELLKNEPEVYTKPPAIQLNLLIIQPWSKVASSSMLELQSTVIVIDALDECENVSSVLCGLIPAIHKQNMPRLKFLLTSRPEENVQKHLNMNRPLHQGSQVEGIFLHDVERILVKADIAKFIQEQLKRLEIPENQINQLAEKSGTLFIYAATMVKFILKQPGLEKSRLNKALSQVAASGKHQTQDLDDLYGTIIKAAIPVEDLSADEVEGYLMVLHTVIIVGRPVSCFTISGLLNMDLSMVEEFIRKLQSVLYEDCLDKSIYIFHTSFRDFALTQSQAGFAFCKEIEHHTLLSKKCFDTLTRLKFNICNLPSSFLADKDVPGIEDKLKNIDAILRYACNFWGYHLAHSEIDSNLVSQVMEFLNTRLVFWIEAMNLTGDLFNCSEIISSLEKVCETFDVENCREQN